MGLEGEGSGGRGGGKWGERGREVGIGCPPVHPLRIASTSLIIKVDINSLKILLYFFSFPNGYVHGYIE